MLFRSKKKGKQTIENAILSLESIYNKTVGNYLIRLFFDAKSDEIVNMYSEGPITNSQKRLIQIVKKIAPNNNSKWKAIR